MGWTDSAVRRYVRDAGPLLDDLNELTRCDCTTRNAKKAATLYGVAVSERREAPAAGMKMAFFRFDDFHFMRVYIRLDLSPQFRTCPASAQPDPRHRHLHFFKN